MKIALNFKSIPDTDNSPQGPNQQVFIEAHDENGNSINVGEWSADGEYEALTIDCAALSATNHAKHLKQLDDVTAIAVSPGNALASEYMRGMANGLILAQSVFSDKEPEYINPTEKLVIPSDYKHGATYVYDATSQTFDEAVTKPDAK